jgi:hypothetical protein
MEPSLFWILVIGITRKNYGIKSVKKPKIGKKEPLIKLKANTICSMALLSIILHLVFLPQLDFAKFLD